MTDIQIRECFGIASTAPDRVLRNDNEILQSIKNNIGISKIFDDDRASDVLQEIRQEIADYKDDKIIHAEQNEMIDIMLDIIDRKIKEISE